MPHAEYPSGSGCICTVVAEYIDKYSEVEHSVSEFKTHWDIGMGTHLTYQSMTELRDECGQVCACGWVDGCVCACASERVYARVRVPPAALILPLPPLLRQSRIDGGMHFQPAVDDSYTLCGDIGAKAYTDYVQPLLGMSASATFDDAFMAVDAYPEPMDKMFIIPS